MTESLSTEQLVVEELQKRGWEAHYEYPGYVNLVDRESNQSYCSSGWVNDTWTVDVYNLKRVGPDLHEMEFDIPVEGLDTQIPKDFKNVELIADMMILYLKIRREVVSSSRSLSA